MRHIGLLPLLLVAACSEAPPPKAEAPKAAASLDAGQWQVASEVAALRSTDKSTPALDTPVGTRATHAACVAEAERKKPAPALFTGGEYQCSYDTLYLSGGLVNGALTCTREGMPGRILMNIDGAYTATGFDAELTMTSYLSGSGDFTSAARLTGKRVGGCA